MTAERLLVSLPVSPFSERARWALDHHRLAYKTFIHEPFVGEGKLRKVVGPGKKATAPVLVEGDVVITDSTAIARHADAIGASTTLFPAGRDADIDHWVALANDASSAGRALVTRALLNSPRALDETLPPLLGPLRPLLRPVTRHGTRWFGRKYNVAIDDDAIAAATAAVRQALLTLRAALAGKRCLLDEFSYADIVAALILQSATPVKHAAFPLLPATRAAWTSPALTAEFSDLLAWRDELYATHRPLPVRA